MTKRRYFIDNFLECSEKNRLAISTRQLFEKIDLIFQMSQNYADELNIHSPRQILHNMTLNNENIFGPGLPVKISCVNTLCQAQSSQEPSTPVKENSNSCFPRKQLKYGDNKNENLDIKNIETETSAIKDQESDRFLENPDRLSRLAKIDENDSVRNEDSEIEINLKEVLNLYDKSEENIKNLMRKNLVRIISMSIIRESEGIGVEIVIWISILPNENLPEKPEQDYGSSEITDIPDKGKTKLPKTCSSKRIEITNFPSHRCDFLLTINYSDPNIIHYLAQRLSSIMSGRKEWMKQMHNWLESFFNDVSFFNSTINKLKSLIEEFLLVMEGNFSGDFDRKCGNDQITKALEISEKALTLIKDVKTDSLVWKKCLQEIDVFVEKQGQLLSTNKETVLTIDDLKMVDLRLNEICKHADSTLISQDGRNEILLNLFSDFEWLVKHFVKFLIVAGILKPPQFLVSDSGKEK